MVPQAPPACGVRFRGRAPGCGVTGALLRILPSGSRVRDRTPAPVQPRRPAAQVKRVAPAVVGLCIVLLAGDCGRLSCRRVVEWLNEEPVVYRLNLPEDFGLQQPSGRLASARKGNTLDSASIPLVFRDTIGLPFECDWRRRSSVCACYSHVITHPCRDIPRMFYRASLAEGAARSMPTDLGPGGSSAGSRRSSTHRARTRSCSGLRGSSHDPVWCDLGDAARSDQGHGADHLLGEDADHLRDARCARSS